MKIMKLMKFMKNMKLMKHLDTIGYILELTTDCGVMSTFSGLAASYTHTKVVFSELSTASFQHVGGQVKCPSAYLHRIYLWTLVSTNI